MFRLIVSFCLICFSPSLCGQESVGSGYAISFDGVDDYVDLGNIYDDLELPMTISAWIMLDLRGLGTIFASQDNSRTYNGFHFYVVQDAIIIEYGDGLGNVSADFRRGKSGPVDRISGKWVHVTAVVRGASDMDLFLNGTNIGGTYIGNSQATMNSSFPLEIAKIGNRSAIGINYHFQGMMDELRIWNIALSETEIRDQMCKRLRGDEAGLVGYWDFDESKGNVSIDKSPNHFVGQLVGEPNRVFSGAPIGDESVYLYTNDWSDAVVSLSNNSDKVSVLNVTDNPHGLHLYKVDKIPSQNAGLNLITMEPPYFGVFVAGGKTDNFFDLEYAINDTVVCKLFTRHDNSVAGWTAKGSSLNHVDGRVEVIKEKWAVSLELDLGADEYLCTFTPRVLMSLSDSTGFDFLWQDGSKWSMFDVSDFGTYWLSVDNGCTSASDTVKISRIEMDSLEIPNVFTPNGDHFNQLFEIDERMLGSTLVIYNRWGEEVYQSSNYQNDWNGEDLSPSVYFYSLKGGECFTEKSGTLSIFR